MNLKNVLGGIGAINRPGITLHKKLMDATDMVGMVVAEDDRVEFGGGKRQLGGDCRPIVPRVNPAIKENAKIPELDKVHRPSDTPGGPPKGHRVGCFENLGWGTDKRGGGGVLGEIFHHPIILENSRDFRGRI